MGLISYVKLADRVEEEVAALAVGIAGRFLFLCSARIPVGQNGSSLLDDPGG